MSNQKLAFYEEWGQYTNQLSKTGILLWQQKQLTFKTLSHEIEHIFQGKLKLLRSKKNSRAREQQRTAGFLYMQVTLGEAPYGMLEMVTQKKLPVSIQREFLMLIADMCAWILSHSELDMLAGRYMCTLTGERPQLTKRQLQVLELICTHHKQEEIATELNITTATIAKHRTRIYAKLGARNEMEVQRAAYELGFYKLFGEEQTNEQ